MLDFIELLENTSGSMEEGLTFSETVIELSNLNLLFLNESANKENIIKRMKQAVVKFFKNLYERIKKMFLFLGKRKGNKEKNKNISDSDTISLSSLLFNENGKHKSLLDLVTSIIDEPLNAVKRNSPNDPESLEKLKNVSAEIKEKISEINKKKDEKVEVKVADIVKNFDQNKMDNEAKKIKNLALKISNDFKNLALKSLEDTPVEEVIDQEFSQVLMNISASIAQLVAIIMSAYNQSVSKIGG